IVPHTVARADQSALRLYTPDEEEEDDVVLAAEDEDDSAAIRRLEKEMKEAAARLDFEVAAVLRDKIRKLKSLR
ncbi:MAG: UvrB/UvrC motif-containing protein, partial [Akkermansia sp.]|nr:UvrB/UvrC motif-containing protein [Akkermansia sp.]